MQLCGLLSSDGSAVHQLREAEGSESAALLAAFPRLEPVPGGSASGWRTHQLLPAPTRMMKVSVGASGGRDGCLGNVVRVAPLPSSLSERHAYVLDAPTAGEHPGGGGEAARAVFQWHGHTASMRVKASALLLAQTIRSLDRRGACDVHVVGNAELPEQPANVSDSSASDLDANPTAVDASFGAGSPDHQPLPISPSRCRSRSMSQQAHEDRTRAAFWHALHRGTLGTPVPPPIPAEPRALYRLMLIEAAARPASEHAADSSGKAGVGAAAGIAAAGDGAIGDAATGGAARLEPPPRLRVLRAAVVTRTLHSDEVLLSDETLVLDCGSEIYLWCGRKTGGYLRWAARTLARWIVRMSGPERAGEVEIVRESEGCEGTRETAGGGEEVGRCCRLPSAACRLPPARQPSAVCRLPCVCFLTHAACCLLPRGDVPPLALTSLVTALGA